MMQSGVDDSVSNMLIVLNSPVCPVDDTCSLSITGIDEVDRIHVGFAFAVHLSSDAVDEPPGVEELAGERWWKLSNGALEKYWWHHAIVSVRDTLERNLE